MLILTMLSVAFPVVRPEDANRDNRLNLEDTILNVRELVQSAEKPDTFAAGMQNAVVTLQLLAGLKTVIKASGHPGHAGAPPVLDSPCLVSTGSLYVPFYVDLRISEDPLIYKSLSIAPSPPPPRSSFLS